MVGRSLLSAKLPNEWSDITRVNEAGQPSAAGVARVSYPRVDTGDKNHSK
jgi:hypothetical protein